MRDVRLAGDAFVLDITHPLSNATAPWPGDTQFHFEFVCRLSTGTTANVGRFTSGIHSGTHMDAPLHYNDAGLKIPMYTYYAGVTGTPTALAIVGYAAFSFTEGEHHA